MIYRNGVWPHQLTEFCWCRPRLVVEECGEIRVHRHLVLLPDDESRAIVFGGGIPA